MHSYYHEIARFVQFLQHLKLLQWQWVKAYFQALSAARLQLCVERRCVVFVTAGGGALRVVCSTARQLDAWPQVHGHVFAGVAVLYKPTYCL